MPIDYNKARAILSQHFRAAEELLLTGGPVPSIPPASHAACDVVFESRTQAFREVLLGCVLARLLERRIDIRLPYVNLGERAFNGRTLDERVVNPFFHEERIPSSKGPYLSVFRRSVKFDASTRDGVRDKRGFDALLTCITHTESLGDKRELVQFLRHLLYRFAVLREASSVPLNRIQRFSLEQYGTLIDSLLTTPSGGRFPVFLATATFQALKAFCQAPWEVKFQGINVADGPSGAGGDVTISQGGRVLLAVEITERIVDRARVVSTFNTKIGPAGLEDYLFVVSSSEPQAEAVHQSRLYFAQGHEINFVEIKPWIMMILATVGKFGRDVFNREIVDLLGADDVPGSLKMAWNNQVSSVISRPGPP